MFVGVATLTLHIPGARSLKDKRSVIRSFKDRVAARLSVSIAEVGAYDQLQRAVFGVAVVSNDRAVCDEVLAKVVAMAGTLRDAVLADVRTESVPFGDGGSGITGTAWEA